MFQEVPTCLLEIPGVLCITELHLEPLFKGKVTAFVSSCLKQHKDVWLTWFRWSSYSARSYLYFVCSEDAFILIKRCPCCVHVCVCVYVNVCMCVCVGQKSPGLLVRASVEHREDKIPERCSQPQIQDGSHPDWQTSESLSVTSLPISPVIGGKIRHAFVINSLFQWEQCSDANS